QNVTTWYVEGNVYNGSQLIEQTIPYGQYYKSGNVYRYQLTDHVGSVRAIINRTKLSDGTADVIYYADYYPFGSVIQSAGIPSRYGYQGEYSEKDNEPSWNNFYLRNYDPAIGRWLSTDPCGQYWSPYVGMGNNPITGFDPDGGWSLGGDPDKPAYRVLLDEVVVTARSSWKWAANSFNNVNWTQQWDSFQSGMPMWGTSRKFGGAMNKGDYLGAIGYLGTSFAEASTLGLGTLWQKPAQFALTRTSTAIVDDAAKGVGKGTHLVYEGLDAAGNVEYIGITGRDAAVRFGEHLNSGTARSLLDYRVINGETGLSKTQARIWEQTLINQYGLGNTRAIVDHTGAVKQIQDYYAFGMEMNTGAGLNSASNHYKYNGKEKPEIGRAHVLTTVK